MVVYVLSYGNHYAGLAPKGVFEEFRRAEDFLTENYPELRFVWEDGTVWEYDSSVASAVIELHQVV